jgi:glycosyltransferase involved in cell wall biosynthesis
MKILIISSQSNSLITFRGNLIKTFIEKGHNVIAYAPGFSAQEKNTLVSWGTTCEEIYLNRTGTSIINDLKTLGTIYRKINTHRPHLVLAYTVKPVLYGSIAASWAGVPKIYSMITGLGWTFNTNTGFKEKFLRRMIGFLYKVAAKRNNALIFQNPDDQSLFIKLGIINKEKTHRICGSGVDISHYSYSVPKHNPVRFLFIGRLIKEKGLLEFIEACRVLKKKYPDIQCDVLGRIDTNPGGVTAEELESYSAARTVNFYGQQKDVRPFLQQSSVFVLPSYYGEGTPRTALEAMATGRPLVMADSPGCRETVVEGENGFLVPVKDPVALAKAMEKFIKNPGIITPMGKKSRKIAEEKYDVHKVNQDIIRILGL